MKKFLNKINTFFKELSKSHIGEYAANCSYFTLLAFIPFLMLILTLTKYFELDKQILNLTITNNLPNNILNNTLVQIIREVYSKSIGTITISIVFILWSSGKGFYALSKGLNVAYGLERKNKFMYFRLRGLLCTIIFIILIILSLVLLVFGNRINIFLQKNFNIFNKIIYIILANKFLISMIVLSVIFTFMYKFIPKHKVRLKDQIIGAIFSATACNVISIFYAVYVNIYTGFSVMYGSLTSIVLAMMWVYACMYSILLGAFINKKINDNKAIN